jgi:hypothetical protein
VQAVGADHQVEALRRALLERDLAVCGDRRDGVAEDVLDVVGGGGVQDLAQVVTHDLDVPP